MNAMIVVTHLLGSGHLARALVLARAFSQAGHRVTVVSGGVPVPHLDTKEVNVVQLPPLSSDGVDFSRLLDDRGDPAKPKYFTKRIITLTETLRHHAPDVLITELYPFGRRILKSEFLALLEAAKSMHTPPIICASIRDILAPPSKPAKAEETAAILQEFYSVVLVHSDETLTPLEASWPVNNGLQSKLRYTGYVAPQMSPPHPQDLGKDEILVSAGGGNVGDTVFETALAAASLDPTRTWRLLVGGSDANNRCERLSVGAPRNAIVERSRPDFRSMLHHAAASVSMCGYNTALDILQSDVPAVLVPFDAGNEVEQTLRARTLSQLNGIDVLPEQALTAKGLLDRITAVIADPLRNASHYKFDGARETVEIVRSLVEGT